MLQFCCENSRLYAGQSTYADHREASDTVFSVHFQITFFPKKPSQKVTPELFKVKHLINIACKKTLCLEMLGPDTFQNVWQLQKASVH